LPLSILITFWSKSITGDQESRSLGVNPDEYKPLPLSIRIIFRPKNITGEQESRS